MNEYLKVFENNTQYETFTGTTEFVLPNVSYCIQEKEVHYNPYDKPQHDYSQDYFTIVSTADNNTIGWRASDVSNLKTISVSTDDGQTWTNKTSSTAGTTLVILNKGDKLLIKGSNTAYSILKISTCESNYFTSTNNFDVEGNIMSLIYEDNFVGQTTLSSNYTFTSLFSWNSKLISVENLILPATTLASSCYASMFLGCASLTTTPATLPATTLAQDCYNSMFNGCTSLNYVKCLATNISASNCTTSWVYNVAASGTFVKDSSMSSWTTGASGIPTGWIKMNENELPIKWGNSNYTYAINSLVKPKLANPYNVPVTFSSSDTTIATIDNYGNVSYLDEGTCTLTAIFSGNNDYQAKTVTCTLTITEINYTQSYLTIVSLEDNNTIGWKVSESSIKKTISISTDNGITWTEKVPYTNTANTLAILNTGDKILIKGSNTTYGTSSHSNYFTSTANFNVEGNIMSLIYGDNFIGQTTLSSAYKYTFRELFYNCTKLRSAENLKLPLKTLINYCYSQMFCGCTSLTTAPELPATTLAENCYNGMFYNCRSLISCPQLPVTTLVSSCYVDMFRYCTSLTNAPVLPATTLARSCYFGMFYGCTSLTTAPALPVTTLANYCYSSMFYGCTSLTTAPELPATILTTQCYREMFRGCTSLTTASELSATTLATTCYYGMFYGCTSLNYIKCLATDISATNCTNGWVTNVAATGTFVKDTNMSSWTTGTSGIPTGWTVQDA